MVTPLEFEKNIHMLESKLSELEQLSKSGDMNIASEIERLKKKIEKQLQTTYTKLTPWQKVLVARHPDRPLFSEYVQHLIQDFVELCGDRKYSDDQAIIGGLGRFRGQTVIIMGHQKGRDTESR